MSDQCLCNQYELNTNWCNALRCNIKWFGGEGESICLCYYVPRTNAHMNPWVPLWCCNCCASYCNVWNLTSHDSVNLQWIDMMYNNEIWTNGNWHELIRNSVTQYEYALICRRMSSTFQNICIDLQSNVKWLQKKKWFEWLRWCAMCNEYQFTLVHKQKLPVIQGHKVYDWNNTLQS